MLRVCNRLACLMACVLAANLFLLKHRNKDFLKAKSVTLTTTQTFGGVAWWLGFVVRFGSFNRGAKARTPAARAPLPRVPLRREPLPREPLRARSSCGHLL